MIAVITVENRSAYDMLVSKCVHAEGVSRIREVYRCPPPYLLIYLTDQVLDFCLSGSFGFNSYALDLVHFILRTSLCVVLRYHT